MVGHGAILCFRKEDRASRGTALLLGVIFAVGIAIGAIGIRVLGAQPELVRCTVLLRTELAGMEGQEGGVWLIEIAPGAATGKHYHPGHEFVYALKASGNF